MPTYTVAELKDQTSVIAVNTWSDTKILLYQTTAESILDSLDLDTSASNYSTAYTTSVQLLFDWLAENPIALKSVSKGKISKDFYAELPITVRSVLKKSIEGESGTLSPAPLARRDIGLR